MRIEMLFVKMIVIPDGAVACANQDNFTWAEISFQTTILRMMDEEDGVRNRRTLKKVSGGKKKSEQRLLLRDAESTEDLEM